MATLCGADILAAAEDRDVLAGIDISFRVSRAALQAMRQNPDRDILFYLALATASLTENEAPLARDPAGTAPGVAGDHIIVTEVPRNVQHSEE